MRRGAAPPIVLAASLWVAAIGPMAAELGDPTRPARGAVSRAEPSPTDEVLLRAVVIGDDHRYAVIGSRRVAVGDQVAGGRVVAIDLAGVRLRRGGHDVVLTLGGSGSFKQPAAGARTGGGSK